RLVDGGSSRFEVVLEPPAVEDRLQQSAADRPHAAAVAEYGRQISADAPEKSGQVDGRKEQSLRHADVGVGCDEELLGLHDIRTPLQEGGGEPWWNGG